MNRARNTLCALGCRNVSKIERRINPNVPTKAAIIERIDRIFSHLSRFLAKTPLCLNHRSVAKERSRKTVVITEPVMKRGFRPSAPTSEM
jgi:hypothetical protein